MKMGNQKSMPGSKGDIKNYKKLLVMIVMSFLSMFVLMYAMVDTFGNVFINVNQFYMAGLMTTPMIIIELCLMHAMYANKKLNALLIAISSIALIVFFLLIRQQSAVGDIQFLRSMIPHHGAAILMGENASAQDPEIKELIRNIIKNQTEEIEQMKAKLIQLEK